jgi:imidazolonepropionase-like amidohydrolase
MGVTILRNASVLDPEKGELAPGQSVVVEGGRIADVGPGLSGPGDALILDAAGRTVMPGLIDAHTHPAIDEGAAPEAASAGPFCSTASSRRT